MKSKFSTSSLESEDSASDSKEPDLFGPLLSANKTPSAKPSSKRTGPTHQSTTMSEPSQQMALEELTSFAAAGLANQSAKLDTSEAQMIRDGSGRKCLDLSKNSGPFFFAEKTLLVSTKWDFSIASWMTWKAKTTKRGRLLFHLQVRANATDENGVLFWPTPRASDSEGGIEKNVQLKNGRFSRVSKKGVRYGVKLRDAVAHLGQGKHMNPQFCEQLMGFPVGWTEVDTKPSATQSARKLLKKSEEQSLQVNNEPNKN